MNITLKESVGSSSLAETGANKTPESESFFIEKNISVPENASPNEIPQEKKSIFRNLCGYSIITVDVFVRSIITLPILLVVCTLSIPVAFIKINIDTLINRYKHYKRYHPGTLLFRSNKTLVEKKMICRRMTMYHDSFLCNFLSIVKGVTLSKSQVSVSDADSVTRWHAEYSKKNNTLKNAQLHIQLPHKISVADAENIKHHEAIMDHAIDDIKKFMIDLYSDHNARNKAPEDNEKLIELQDKFSDSLEELIKIIPNIVEEKINAKNAVTTKKDVNIVGKLNIYLQSFIKNHQRFSKNKICSHCCNKSVSDRAEVIPYFLRSSLFTLIKLPYFIFVAPIMGVMRSATMTLSFIWGERYGVSRPVNYFPWHLGELHRFPFTTPIYKGLQGMHPETDSFLFKDEADNQYIVHKNKIHLITA
ncbi:MAG: hypothetical protein KAG53_12075 [Endozoicomonadaceae bacterium]|nr:hypothetical protein [Endozoicomonadaceae bacterium]